MKFKFRLESVMKIRKNEEQVALQTMLESQNRLSAAQRELNGMYDAIEAAIQGRFLSSQNQMTSREASYVDEFVDGQNTKIENQKKLIRGFQREFEATQDSYRDSLLKLRVLEKMKENKLDEFKKKLSKREVMIVDDLVSSRFMRDGEAT